MSKVAIQGNASGTGTFTIAAPNSNTDRTLTLPDEAGTVLTSASSIPVANLDSAVGITMADQFRLTTDLTGSANPITSNLARVDEATFSGIGTGMSESSGIFTFPSTGIYLIHYSIVVYISSTSDYCRGFIQVSNDSGVNYDAAAVAYASAASTGTPFNSGSTQFIFDVTDTTTHKVCFRILQANASNEVRGLSTQNATFMTFIRLGDT